MSSFRTVSDLNRLFFPLFFPTFFPLKSPCCCYGGCCCWTKGERVGDIFSFFFFFPEIWGKQSQVVIWRTMRGLCPYSLRKVKQQQQLNWKERFSFFTRNLKIKAWLSKSESKAHVIIMECMMLKMILFKSDAATIT